jgi:hypothetical protein
MVCSYSVMVVGDLLLVVWKHIQREGVADVGGVLDPC